VFRDEVDVLFDVALGHAENLFEGKCGWALVPL
jgi:hypothetical protein